MDDELTELMDGEMIRLAKKLKELSPESQEYSDVHAELSKMRDDKHKEEKLIHDASESAKNRAQEDERMVHEIRLKREETKQMYIRSGADLAKTTFGIGCIFTLAKATFDCEKVGRPTSWVWKFIQVPKLF